MPKTFAKFALFDFANTICPGHFIGEFNLYFARVHLHERRQEMELQHQLIIEKLKSNRITYNQIVTELSASFADLLKGYTLDEVQHFIRPFIDQYRIYPYVKPLFEYLYRQGFEVKILTADFEFMIARLLARLPRGFILYPSKMHMENGRFTGQIDLLHNNTFKQDTVREIERSNPASFTVAFGDSEGDLPMLNAADLGFLINNAREFARLENNQHIIHITNPGSQQAAEEIIKNLDQFRKKSLKA